MNSITLENFINYCDEMMIANESHKDMHDIMKSVSDLSAKFDHDCKNINDIKTMIEKYDVFISELTELRELLQKTNFSFTDRLKQTFGVCASALTIAGSVWLSCKASKIHLGLLTAIVTGQISLIPTLLTGIYIQSKTGYINGLNGFRKAARLQQSILRRYQSLGAKTKKDTLSYTVELDAQDHITIYDKNGNIVSGENEIVTEGAILQINKVFKNLKNEILVLQKKIREANGKPEEQIQYFRKYKELLTKAEDSINTIPVGKMENPFVGFITSLVPVFASLAVTITWGMKTGGMNKPVNKLSDLKELTPMLAGAGGALAIGIKTGTRRDCLSYIQESRKVTNQIIAYLESVNTHEIDGEIKSDKDYEQKLYRKAINANKESIRNLISKIYGEIKPLIVKESTKNNISIKFYMSHGYLYVDLINGKESKLFKIVDTIISDIYNQHRIELDRFGIKFNAEVYDDSGDNGVVITYMV